MNNAGPSRRPLDLSKAKAPDRDIWGLGLTSDLPPDASPRPSRKPSLRRRADPHGHPLYRTQSPPAQTEVLSDVSRPNLTRLTSDLERRAGSSRGSEDGSRRGSTDRLRMTKDSEVEVLIHQVQANESLAGIALLYGIDLATLRKTNKLWTSDPVHLRRHLYVPLEACKWNKASETLVRGPGEGEATLAPKNPKGKGREENLIDLDDPDEPEASVTSKEADEVDPWGFSPPRPLAKQTPRSQSPSPSRTANIVRIPSSQLQFFPKPPRPDSNRTSLDSGPRATVPPPLSIQNDLHFSHRPVISRKSSLPGMIQLRPPTSAPSSGTGLADRFSNLFYIPPPPSGIPPPRSRSSMDSRSSPGSIAGSPKLPPTRPVEEVEMARRGSGDTLKPNSGKGRRKLD